MISVKTLDKLTSALLANDTASAMLAIEEEIEVAKNKNQHNQVVKLRSILKRITGANTTNATSASSFRNSPKDAAHLGSELYEIDLTDIKLETVILESNNKETVKSIINEWERKGDLFEAGLSPVNRVLLHGPPGTGKTKLANAIANELGYPIMTVHLDELMSSYLGKTGKNIREVFDVANKGKIVLFLDEVDAIAKQRGDSQDIGELKRVVTVFLQNLDRLSPFTIVIGATNHEELLDRAIWRRFPVRLRLLPPGDSERKKIFDLFLGKKAKKLDTAFLASISEGMSGSVIEEACYRILKNAFMASDEVSMKSAIKHIYYLNGTTATNSKKVHWKAEDYQKAQRLFEYSYTIREIESLTGIPYTTLKGHIG